MRGSKVWSKRFERGVGKKGRPLRQLLEKLEQSSTKHHEEVGRHRFAKTWQGVTRSCAWQPPSPRKLRRTQDRPARGTISLENALTTPFAVSRPTAASLISPLASHGQAKPGCKAPT